MPNNTPQLVSLESLARKHEVSEKRVRNVLIIGGGAAFLLVLSLLVCGVMIRDFAQKRPMQNMQPLGLVSAPNLKPLERFPKPNLQIVDDYAERMALYAGQNAELNSYGWIDRSNGIVRIPIVRAMDLILQRGLPTRTNFNSQADGSKLQLIQKISEQP
jgi:hypothetical protein